MSDAPQKDDADENLAFKRYMFLNGIRILGIITICAGIATQERLLPLPPVFAYVLAIAGFLIFFFLPRHFAQGWRSNDQ
ncbi:hypothetical protein [Altererythrobacter lutimaris]|uniref:Uncharacterized protein n=1 Tax=Altererythrobacter lutimaris TaxID=2743979 RepID=A0A850HDH2_9SPHN|nr:hypothetical protein [Altererythrobacter lutimaris]NVE94778.1 hypothetical protein [Altererythrobacter lutimaris]